ncbi:cyclin-dependent kinase 2-interacting protein isoform X3 [Bubalus bubalis]|uniref:cyclin-dependent kinase 2-interacting protein isoform X3 n=1 Tax=Bubalus bubalis TaxID=89462 RepID=UPI001D0FC6A5|nr:cyclin-dependent kinase 2-interacting protein isoform X3 [Bubalus bubalis]
MGMDSGPRGLPGVRSLGNGTGTAEEQPAPPPARAAEPDLGAVGVSEVTQRTSGPIGGASDLFSGIPAEGMEAKTLGTVTPRKPVLSVSARKIKDNAADWHNLILKWETLNDGGFATANSIANMKISLSSKDKIELASSGLASDDCAEKEHPEYSRELETLCEELQATLEGLREWFPRLDLALNLALVEGGGVHVPQLDEHFTTKIQMKMEKLSSTTKGVCELEDYHHGEERKCPPLFHTWPTAHFSNAAVRGGPRSLQTRSPASSRTCTARSSA